MVGTLTKETLCFKYLANKNPARKMDNYKFISKESKRTNQN